MPSRLRPGSVHFARWALPLGVLALAALVACGGSGGSDAVAVGGLEPTPTVPLAMLKEVFVDATGQAGRASLNATGQLAYNTVTAAGPRARFFDGVSVRAIPGDVASRAVAVNDAGEVTGQLLQPDGSTRAFRWSTGTPETLVVVDTQPGTSTVAADINRSGQVAGTLITRNLPQAFRWTPGTSFQPLESAGFIGPPLSEGHFINTSGAVAGLSSTLSGAHAALWVPGQAVRDLGTLGGLRSTPAALNDAGQVAGQAQTAAGANHAFRWSEAEGMRDLGTLGGATSGATAMNARGWVVGTADTALAASQAFVWREGTLLALGTLGGRNSAATAIDSAGQVGGTAQLADGTAHAFTWTAESGMVDLHTRAVLRQPAVLQSVIALSDDGSVLVSSSAGLMLLKP